MVEALKDISHRLTPKKDASASSMDLLADVLTRTRTGGIVFACSRLHGPWGFQFSGHRYWGFHLIHRGSCWLHIDALDLIKPLSAGDLVIVGSDHALTSHPDAPVVSFEKSELARPGAVDMSVPCEAELICGAYDFESETPHPIFSSLPTMIHVPAHEQPAAIATLLDLIQSEVSLGLPGGRILGERLMDALLIYILRYWLAHEGKECGGWLGALRHPSLAKAIALLHQFPAHPWTVEVLARDIGMSRASLARHFQQEVGSSPMQYLNRWRLDIACQLLRQSDLSLDEIATQTGYSTGFSLSKAFKQVYGVSPGRFRGKQGSAHSALALESE